jgi:hypothetical protein
MFVTLRNDGPIMDESDKHWSMIVHGDGSKHLRIVEDDIMWDEDLDEIYKELLHKFIHR